MKRFKDSSILNLFTFEWSVFIIVFATIYSISIFLVGITTPFFNVELQRGSIVEIRHRDVLIETENGIKVICNRAGNFYIGQEVELELIDNNYSIK